MQNRAMRDYAARRGSTIVMQVKEVGSGASQRVAAATGEKLIDAARRREIDVVLVWRLDRWGRSVTDQIRKLSRSGLSKSQIARRSASAAPLCAVSLPLRPGEIWPHPNYAGSPKAHPGAGVGSVWTGSSHTDLSGRRGHRHAQGF